MRKKALVIVLRCAALAAIGLAMASCAARQTAQKIDSELGCHFDAVKVCEQALTKPVATSSGLTTSNSTYISQNSLATTWLMAPVKAPGGSEIDVQCQVNYSKKQVIYAYPTPSGTVSASDRKWLIQTGLCVEKGSTAVPSPAGAKALNISPTM